jgi:alpha-glucosidase (family GH31 glycosyl hydrolase)
MKFDLGLSRVVGALLVVVLVLHSSAAARADRAAQEKQVEQLRADWRDGKLAERVEPQALETIKLWLDLLESEGCVHPSGFEKTPVRMFDMLKQAQAEQARSSPQLPISTDWLMRQLDDLSSQWYADGTVGNRSTAWTAWPAMKLGSVSDGMVELLPVDGATTNALFIEAFEGDVVRIRGTSTGFFDPRDKLKRSPINAVANGDSIDLTWDGGSGVVTLQPLTITLRNNTGRSWTWKSPELLANADASIRATRQFVALNEADRCIGLGERFNALDHRGTIVNNWVSDAIMGGVREKYTETYKPVPLMLNPGGASLFVNNQSFARLDLGASDPQAISIVGRGDVIDAFVFLATPMDVLKRYTQLTGRPRAMPDWAFTPWAGGGTDRWNKINPDVKAVDAVRQVVDKFAELDIPHGAIYIEGVPTGPGEGQALLDWLHARNLKPLAWYGPNDGGDQTYDYSPEQLRTLFLRHKANDGFFVVPPERFLAGQRYIDYTNPLSLELTIKKWKWHLDAGIEGCMIDGGEEVPLDGVAFNGLQGDVLHNLYPWFYHRVKAQLFDQVRPTPAMLFGRSGGPGDQANLAQFPGDLPGDWGGLAAAVRGLLTASSSGFSSWGSDVGGYYTRNEAPLQKELYVRWAQFGFFSPITRFHAATQAREPWLFDEETVQTYRYFAWLRMNLQPYLIAAGGHATATGTPIARPLYLVHPEDTSCAAVDDQYLLGDALLVAPVLTDKLSRSIVLPPGTWYDLSRFRTGPLQPIAGGQTVEREVPLGELPLFGRSGSVVPVRLNARWQLGGSMKDGARDVRLLLIDPTNPNARTEDGSIQAVVVGQDLVIRSKRDMETGLWIPTDAPNEVHLNGSPLGRATNMESLGQGQYVFDTEMGRLCAVVSLRAGQELRVVNYVRSSK